MCLQYKVEVFGTGNKKIELTLLNEPAEKKLGGMMSSELFAENIAIVVEDNPQTVEYDFACLAYKEDGTAPRVMMKSNIYKELKKGTTESKVIVFHEIGHYFNGDMIVNTADEDKEREELVANNEVSIKELKADAFAVQYLGAECVVQGLNDLKNRILNEYADYDAESVKLSAKEIDIRILLTEKNKDLWEHNYE